MKAWLAFYVTENGERKSKTFSTRKLGMEVRLNSVEQNSIVITYKDLCLIDLYSFYLQEARLQAIAFCKQKQDQRREARKRSVKFK